MSEIRHQELSSIDGVPIHAYHLGDPKGVPIVMLPGGFSNHTFWLGTKGFSCGHYLAEAGLRIVVLDVRGHGFSKEKWLGKEWKFEDWFQKDLLALLRDLDEEVILVGHSAGGAAVYCALAQNAEMHQQTRAFVAASTPIPLASGKRKLLCGWAMVMCRTLGYFPGKMLGLSSQDEVGPVMDQWMSWNYREDWIGKEGYHYTEVLDRIEKPLLMMSGLGDHDWAPPKMCEALADRTSSPTTKLFYGTALGHSEDYNHPGLIISKNASREVWPTMLGWLSDFV